MDLIAEALYPDAGADPAGRKKRRQSVWKLADALRDTLGWPGAVRSLRGAYELDPSADWLYDVAEARAGGAFTGEFLAGVYLDWALEVGRSLGELSGRTGRAAGLH